MFVSVFLKKREIRGMGEIATGEPVSISGSKLVLSLYLGHLQRESVMALLDIIQSVRTGSWMEKLRNCVIDQSGIRNCVNLA